MKQWRGALSESESIHRSFLGTMEYVKLKSFYGKNSYIKGIDGLRALAVLAVMLFHIDPSFLPGGFSGVDVFFVISGYVVSASLVRYSNSNFFDFTVGFYARRIIRIFPALIVCLVIVSIVTTIFIPESWLSSTSSKTGLLAFFGLGNYALIWFNDGYFSPRVEFNSFTHTWSLGVEEQFYVIFPLIIFIWIKYKKRKNLLGLLANWLLAVLLILSLFYSYFETSSNPNKAFYLLPSRFWELACGALLFQFHSRQKIIADSLVKQHFYLLSGIILIGLGFVFSDKQSFPFPWAILSVSGAALLISGLVNNHDGNPLIKNILESQVFVQIGKTSYSLYLWHWPVYVFFRWTVGLESIFEICLAVLLTFMLANVSYYLIEKPIREHRSVINCQNWQAISSGIATIIISFLLSNFIFKSQPTIGLSVTKNKEIWYPHEWPTEIIDGPEKIFIGRKLFAIGDSHAGAYSTMLQKLSDEYGVEIVKLSTGGCGVANLLRPAMGKGEKCIKEIENLIAKVESSASAGDILFLASLRMNRFGDQWALFSDKKIADSQYSEKSLSDRKAALREAEDLLKKFEKLQVKVLIDAPKPIFKSPPFRCSDWFNSSNPVCLSGFILPQKILLEHRQPVMDSLDKLADNFPELAIWDPFPILCETSVCSAFGKNNMPLFFDGDHLSAHGNRILYPSFKSLIKRMWASVPAR